MQAATLSRAEETPVSKTRARYVIWKNVLAVYDEGGLTGDDYKVLEDAFVAHAARYPKTAALLTVLPQGTRAPSEHTRRALVGTYNRIGHLMRSIVFVVEGSGFTSAMVRATLMTILTLALARRKDHACAFTASIEEGLAVIVSQAGLPDTIRAPIDLAGGVAALESMRPVVDVPAPPQSGIVRKGRWPWSTER